MRGLERFRFRCSPLKIMRGVIFLRKMTFGDYVSRKSGIETAVAIAAVEKALSEGLGLFATVKTGMFSDRGIHGDFRGLIRRLED